LVVFDHGSRWRVCLVGFAVASSTENAVILAFCAVALVAMAFALQWPLATYSVSLATLGLAHVAYEFRYVDGRFGRRFAEAFRWLIGLLVLVGVVRAASVLGAPKVWTTSAELALVITLAGSPMVLLDRLQWWQRIPAALGAGFLALGAIVFPTLMMPVLAVFHNFTPLGFLAEVLRGPRAKFYLAFATLMLVGGPLLLMTGILQTWVPGSPDVSPIAPGPLASHLQAYVASDWHDRPWATHLFQAAVFAQLGHYVCTIVVMPRIGAKLPQQAVFPWPAPWVFAGIVSVATIALGVGYMANFSQARQVYGIAAAMHAWVEFPVLLAVAGGWGRDENGLRVE